MAGTGESAFDVTRETLDAIDEMFYVFDADGTFHYWNENVPAVTGYDEETIETMQPTDFFEADDRDRVADAIDRVFDEGVRVTVEADLVTRGGDRIPYEFSGDLLPSGDETLMAGIGRDVSERAEIERHLREEKRKYETVVEQSHDGVGIVKDGVWQFVNDRLAELTERDVDDLLGESFDEIVAPDYRELVRERYQQRITGDSPPSRYDVELVVPSGDRKVADLRVSRISYGGEPATLASFRDVSERKERERELERYEELVENIPVGIYRLDPTGRGELIEANPALVDLAGAASKAELTDHSVAEFWVDTDERDRYLERAVREQVVTEVAQLQRLDGETIWGQITAIRRESPEGDVYHDGAIEDVTERKEYEQRLRHQRDQLEVLNRIVRHDIRNDMTVVLGFAELLREEVSEDLRGDVDRIVGTSKHTVELTKTVRDLVETMRGDEKTELEAVDLPQALLTEVENTRRTYPDATVEVVGDVPSVSVTANPLLGAVFRNLLGNAVQHNDKAKPRVEVTATRRDGRIVVDVADNGPGIPDERKADLFSKSKTLDEEGGVGLYLVHTLVSSYGGDVDVADNEPDGAVFSVGLPVAETEAEE
jgi:PAS domain S-box-containing protein